MRIISVKLQVDRHTDIGAYSRMAWGSITLDPYAYRLWVWCLSTCSFAYHVSVYSLLHLKVSFLQSQISIRCARSLGLVCHVPWQRDHGDCDWRWRLNDTPNAIGWNTSCVRQTHKPIDLTCLWGGHDEEASENLRSLWQKSPIKETIFSKRDL